MIPMDATRILLSLLILRLLLFVFGLFCLFGMLWKIPLGGRELHMYFFFFDILWSVFTQIYLFIFIFILFLFFLEPCESREWGERLLFRFKFVDVVCCWWSCNWSLVLSLVFGLDWIEWVQFLLKMLRVYSVEYWCLCGLWFSSLEFVCYAMFVWQWMD